MLRNGDKILFVVTYVTESVDKDDSSILYFAVIQGGPYVTDCLVI